MSETTIRWNDGKSVLVLDGEAGEVIAKAWHTMLHHGYGVVILTNKGAKLLPLHEFMPAPPPKKRIKSHE
jgi:hypothetical protein